MTYLFLLLSMSFSAAITIGGKLYNIKNRDVPNVSRLYNMLVPMAASLGWLLLWLFDFSFDAAVLPYSLLYGIGYCCFTVGMLGALKTGSTSLTALIKQIALVGVSLWGFVFWDVPLTLTGGTGIILIVVSLTLCLLTKEEKSAGRNLTQWLFYALLITIGNAGCSIIQRYQQMAFDYRHKNMFMFFGVFFAALVSLVPALREEKTHWKSTFRQCWIFPALTGASSALSNAFVLLLIRYQMSPVIIYPGVAVGGLMITTLISLIFFREKLRPMQWGGLAVGAAALMLLNM